MIRATLPNVVFGAARRFQNWSKGARDGIGHNVLTIDDDQRREIRGPDWRDKIGGEVERLGLIALTFTLNGKQPIGHCPETATPGPRFHSVAQPQGSAGEMDSRWVDEWVKERLPKV